MVAQQTGLDEALNSWLAGVGFSKGNPFADYDAYSELQILPEYFLDAGIFKSLVGDPLKPEAKIVFAPRGGGKTAYWVNLRHESQPIQPSGPLARVLAIPHIRFERLREMSQRGSSITARDHLNEILKYGTLNLLQVLINHPARAERLPAASYGRLRWFCDEFHPDLLQPDSVQRYIERVLGKFPFKWDAFERAVEERKLTPRMREQSASGRALFLAKLVDARARPMSQAALPDEIMAEFVTVVRGADLDAVYVLVDQLDSHSSVQQNPQILLDVIQPLLEAPFLMNGATWACKIFLPEENRDLLLTLGTKTVTFVQRHELRIQWTEDALRKLLSLRLSYYSDNRYTSLDQLCEVVKPAAPARTEGNRVEGSKAHQARKAKTIEDDLLSVSGNLPRTLLKLGRYLFEERSRRRGGVESLTWADWNLALGRYYQEAGLGPLLLRLDSAERRIFKGPRAIPLTEKEYAFIKCLVDHDGKCDRETLVKTVWGPGAVDDPQTVGQLVQRIRKKIENERGKPVFLITEKDYGFRLTGFQK